MKVNGLVVVPVMLAAALAPASAQTGKLSGGITLSGAWAIYPTAVAWGEAFSTLHPKVRVDVSAGGAGKGAADVIAGLVDIGMVSREPDPAEIARGAFPVYVLHDGVFPVVSSRNPVLDQLMRRGIPPAVWFDLYVTGKLTRWDELAGADLGGKPVHVYTRSDSCGAAATWAVFLQNRKQEDLGGIGVYGDPGILETVRRDPLGVGYANFAYVFGRDGAPVPGISDEAIDADGDGTAGAGEILATRKDAARAIDEGRHPVTRRNYFFTRGKPSGLVRAFLEFVLSEEGTAVAERVGASLALPAEERRRVLASLAP